MLGRALGPVVLRQASADGLLRRPGVPRRGLRVGVLATDPADRPGRGARLLDGLRQGLEQARDLDTVVTAVGAPPYGPALLDAAAGLLEAGADVVVVTSTGVAELVGPLCAARGVGLVVADEGDTLVLSYNPAQRGRPAAFAGAGRGTFREVYRRMKR